jgi:hypothetical protein
MSPALPLWLDVALWGLVATAAMTIVLESSQRMGISRLSLPFLFGTFVSGNHSRAVIIGFILYLIGGWLFSALYFAVFLSLGRADIWLGLGIGFAHGIFLVSILLPLLPYVHPRMVTEYDGLAISRRAWLEPPGVFGLNYGRRTPLTTLFAQTLYGGILGAFLPL